MKMHSFPGGSAKSVDAGGSSSSVSWTTPLLIAADIAIPAKGASLRLFLSAGRLCGCLGSLLWVWALKRSPPGRMIQKHSWSERRSTLSEAGPECSQAIPGKLKHICRDGKMPWGKPCLRMGRQPDLPSSSGCNSTILDGLAGDLATHLPCLPVSRDGG